jgi:hypothetical protein
VAGRLHLPISFTIPLTTGLTGTGCTTNPPAVTCHVHYINTAGKEVVKFAPLEEVTSTACTGSAAAPTAVAGNLCVYTAKLEEAQTSNGFIVSADSSSEANGAGIAGALLEFLNVGEEAQGWGTWALTAGP